MPIVATKALDYLDGKGIRCYHSYQKGGTGGEKAQGRDKRDQMLSLLSERVHPRGSACK